MPHERQITTSEDVIRNLPSARSISDFRVGIDKVIAREDGRCFVRDGQGLLADVEVESDLMTERQVSNLRNTPTSLLGVVFQATVACPYLSDTGREQRLTVLREVWAKRFGSATFVVAA